MTSTSGRNATLRIATRRSPLALAQARLVAAEVERAVGRRTELVEITTHLDRLKGPLNRKLAQEAALEANLLVEGNLQPIGGVQPIGVFVGALRDALAAGDADLAVHSYKDLPTAPAAGLVIAAVPSREDPRDALVSHDRSKLADLRVGAVIGTGSPRRAGQLRALRSDLGIVSIRGNVDTRLRRVSERAGGVDAVVLAAAGLARLGRLDEASEVFDLDDMLPAPAQGALAVECLADREDLVRSLGVLDHAPSRVAAEAERALLAALEAGCSAPVGAHAAVGQSDVLLRAVVVSANGAESVRMSATGTLDDPRELGDKLAASMLAEGAASLMGER